MGCINSKNAVAGDSPVDSKVRNDNGSAIVEPPSRSRSGMLASADKGDRNSEDCNRDGKKSRKDSSKGGGNFSSKTGLSHRFVEAELNAAGWPPWLTAAAGEAIHGWVPLRADAFEKLEKAGKLILIFVTARLILIHLRLLKSQFSSITGKVLVINNKNNDDYGDDFKDEEGHPNAECSLARYSVG